MPKVSLDMSSATDIVFLLLIFFILNSSSTSQKSLEIDLPSSANNSEAISGLEIFINADLKIQLGQDVIDRKNLKRLLESHFKQGKNHVLIFSDKSVPIEHLIFIIDQAASVGMKTSIATNNVEDAAS